MGLDGSFFFFFFDSSESQQEQKTETKTKKSKRRQKWETWNREETHIAHCDITNIQSCFVNEMREKQKS